MKELGVHYLLDLSGVPFETADNLEKIKQVFLEALKQSNVTFLGEIYHKFEPQGCSGVILIAESHFSFHTYPEYGKIMCDIFTCGDTAMPEKAIEYIVKNINHLNKKIIKNLRGLL